VSLKHSEGRAVGITILLSANAVERLLCRAPDAEMEVASSRCAPSMHGAVAFVLAL